MTDSFPNLHNKNHRTGRETAMQTSNSQYTTSTVPRKKKTSTVDDLHKMAAAASPDRSVVKTYRHSAKRARTEVADPPRALSGMPATHPNCNWYVQLNLMRPCSIKVFPS
jgi:hypothetical protein